MQQTTDHPTTTPESGLAAAALRAEAWAGEAFLHSEEDPEQVLAPGTARRRALDDALAEMDAGAREPSPAWKVRYGLMLGLERVLSDRPQRLASGTELRRHQVDALAGMLTELIAAAQEAEEPLNGNGAALEEVEPENDDEEPDETSEEDVLEELPSERPDPGAVRRYRFRHPTASGKTIAAAGFVEAARTLGVLILTHRRLLVSQFTRDLTAEGYGDRLTEAIEKGKEPLRGNPLTIQTYAWFARHVGTLSREAYQLVICDEAHTALGEKTSTAIRSFPEPIYIGMTATEQLIAKQVSDVFPASVDDLPLQDAARRGLIAPLRCLRVPPVAAINQVPIIGGDFDQEILAKTLDHQALNQAAASLYRDRFDNTPGIVYADLYREGARVTPAPRRRVQRRARRRLTPAPWLVPVTPDVRRRLAVITREWQRIDPKYLDEDEQRYWATIAGRQIRFDERAAFVEKLTARGASKACLEQFLATCAAENPNRRLRIIALSDRVAMTVERADFDDLVTLVTQAPTWEKDRMGGVRILLRAISEGKADAPEQIVARWTWRLARASRKLQDRRASAEFPEAKRLLGALANSRGHRHEENAAKLVNAALELPVPVGAALLASAEGYTTRATQLIAAASGRPGPLPEDTGALAENLPPPKLTSGRSRRRKR